MWSGGIPARSTVGLALRRTPGRGRSSTGSQDLARRRHDARQAIASNIVGSFTWTPMNRCRRSCAPGAPLAQAMNRSTAGTSHRACWGRAGGLPHARIIRRGRRASSRPAVSISSKWATVNGGNCQRERTSIAQMALPASRSKALPDNSRHITSMPLRSRKFARDGSVRSRRWTHRARDDGHSRL